MTAQPVRPAGEDDASTTPRTVERGPPCRRCKERRWQVESRPKSRLRRWVEMVFALPDVLIFQSDSGGWPKKQAEVWTCLNCGRTARR